MLFLFFWSVLSRTYDLSAVYAYRALARVFSLLPSPHDVSVYESSRNTSLDPDSHRHIEGVYPKERVTYERVNKVRAHP